MSKGIIGVTVGTSISPISMEDRIKPVKSVNGVVPDENGNVTAVLKTTTRELFFSGNADDFENHIYETIQPTWLNTTDDFDFKVRFSVSNGLDGSKTYEFTKADCVIPIIGNRKHWEFYATVEGTSRHILTVASGTSIFGWESNGSLSFYYPDGLNDFSLEFFKLSYGEPKFVTSVNGVTPDYNGNVDISVIQGEKGDKGDQGEKGEKGDKGDKGDSGVMTVNGVAPDENGNVEIPTGGGSSGGCTKTLLWTSTYGISFHATSLYLPIGGYDAIEILYESEIGDKHLSTSGEIPLRDGYTSWCNLFALGGTYYTYIKIGDDGKFTFNFKDDEYCTPKFIYGIKYANPVVQSDNALASAGYKPDTYISAGDEEDNAGTDLTGFIQVAVGDVVRLKNVTMPDVNGYENKVYFYRSNKTTMQTIISITSDNTANSPVFKNGNLVQFTVLKSDINGTTGYIRINASNIDKYSIITVNKEIE